MAVCLFRKRRRKNSIVTTNNQPRIVAALLRPGGRVLVYERQAGGALLCNFVAEEPEKNSTYFLMVCYSDVEVIQSDTQDLNTNIEVEAVCALLFSEFRMEKKQTVMQKWIDAK